MSKNATPSDNSDGQDESIDSELHTDGGVSRRRFLGAAVALSALPMVSQGVAADDSDLEMSERQEQVLDRGGDLEISESTKQRVAEALDEDGDADG